MVHSVGSCNGENSSQTDNGENSQMEEDLLRDIDTNVDFIQVDKENARSSESEEEIKVNTEEQRKVTADENEESSEVTHRGQSMQIHQHTQEKQDTNEDKKEI
ncbi:unnamed protein product [Meganyctiphanes norvegica]|uniref:Uncharacterized protein n=1 Tax=Meganyctiphanes norvegica TaxID=48144 RepID=A0AAV2RBA8_MEGNR